MIRGPQHAAFAMGDATCVGQARRHGAVASQRVGLDDVQAAQVGIVVTELGNNLVNHASDGALFIAAYDDRREVEVVAVDRGPGIADVARSLTDGFSTGGTLGTGLGAVKRLADDFHLHSSVPHGTIIVARLRATQPAEERQAVIASGLAVALAGELACGDAWAFAADGPSASVMVADGLGHGAVAAEAAQAAVDVFLADPFAPTGSIVSAAHARLRSTRGAALMVVHLSANQGEIRACGAGNVSCRVVSGAGDRSIPSQHGTVGLQIRRPEETRTPWPPHAVVVLHSDGLETRWNAERFIPLLRADPLVGAAALMRDHSRGRDDTTVFVARRAE